MSRIRPHTNFFHNCTAALTLPAIACTALILCPAANAQVGQIAGASAVDLPAPTAAQHQPHINPEAWDSFVSGDTERMFGEWSEQTLRLNFEYRSEASLWGYRIGEQVLVPSLELLGPLFGGESYTEVRGYLPTQGDNYANQLWVIGGWRYHLTPYLDVDVGGNFVFADKRLGGPGVAANAGWRARGTIYLGLVGRHWLQPSLYGVYDFELDQPQVFLGLLPSLSLESLGIDAPGFFLDGQFAVSYLKGNRWFGEPNPDNPIHWSNAYVYWETGVRLRYEFDGTLSGASAHIGVSYSGRANGNASLSHPDPVVQGPRNQVSFNAGISYGF